MRHRGDEDGIDVRALHLIASADRRGAEVFAVDLADRLWSRGVGGEVRALAPARTDNALDVPVTRLVPQRLMALRRAARRTDVVIGHGSRGLPGSTLATVASRRPAIYRSIGDPSQWGGSSLARRARVALQLRRAARVVALWPGAADTIADLFGVLRTKIVVIPNGVAADRFGPADDASRSHARRAFGLGDGPVAVVVGAHGPEKRIPLAVEALGRVDGLQVLVAGDGPQRPEVEAAARRWPDRIKVLGVLDEVMPLYVAADVIVNVSRTEGQPAVVLEGALSGLAVVATDVGGTASVTGPRRVLLPADPGPDAIADAVRTALDLPPTPADDLAALRARYDLGTVADQWAALLRSVAGVPPRAPSGARPDRPSERAGR